MPGQKHPLHQAIVRVSDAQNVSPLLEVSTKATPRFVLLPVLLLPLSLSLSLLPSFPPSLQRSTPCWPS
jgi:hypothetical protein